MSKRTEQWADTVAELSSKLTTARERYSESRELSKTANARVLAIEKARTLVQSIAQDMQEQAHSAIASVVSKCLEAVFEAPYSFKILFEQKRGRTEARLVFERDGLQVDPMTASGGGVVDVAAFALRLACLKLKRPKSRPLIVLDEPFKSPSPHYRERVRQLIETLAEEMGVQFVMVTNIMELVTGNVIDLGEAPAPANHPKQSGKQTPRTSRKVG